MLQHHLLIHVLVAQDDLLDVDCWLSKVFGWVVLVISDYSKQFLEFAGYLDDGQLGWWPTLVLSIGFYAEEQ